MSVMLILSCRLEVCAEFLKILKYIETTIINMVKKKNSVLGLIKLDTLSTPPQTELNLLMVD